MNAKSVLTAVLLIGLGIVFGVVLVSSFNSPDKSFALTDPNAVLGVSNRVLDNGQTPSVDTHALSNAFINAAERIVPTVVSITVTSTQDSRRSPRWFDEFHRFFEFDSRQQQPMPQRGSGSGVIVSPEGYIITNNHVVANADKDGIRVMLNDRREFSARLVGTDENTDLAVIKIDANNLPVAEFGNSDALRVGEWVLAVGNPLQLMSTVTHGIISAIGRGDLNVISGNYRIENFIQTDAAINPGNSGGPLVNLNGEVIGINVAIATRSARFEGYGFAIPINLARVVVENIVRYGYVRRAYLGVQISNVDETLARAVGLDKVRGVLVQEILKDGPASKSDLKAGDIILKLDDKEVNQPNELQMEIARREPESNINVTVFRDGRERTIRVTLGLLGDEARPVADAQPRRDDRRREQAEPEVVRMDELGLVLRQVDSNLKRDREVDGGVLVQSVAQFSIAAERQIFQGDIIIEADRKPVNTIDDFKSIIAQKKPGDAILLRVKSADGSFRFVALNIPGEPS